MFSSFKVVYRRTKIARWKMVFAFSIKLIKEHISVNSLTDLEEFKRSRVSNFVFKVRRFHGISSELD